MLAILLGLLDLVSGIFMLLLHFDLIHWRAAFGFALYLLAKGFLFKTDFLSMIDLLVGVYIVLMFFGIRTFLVYVFFAYLVYKFILSTLPIK